MADETGERVDAGVSDRYRKASPWPLFVALGLAISEVGVVFGFVPVAVGGLLLFGGAIAGIVQEAGYADRPWGLLAGVGALFATGGALVVATQTAPGGVADAVLAPSGIGLRGLAIAAAGAILAAAGGIGAVLEPDANQ
jgi:hypothetical protein